MTGQSHYDDEDTYSVRSMYSVRSTTTRKIYDDDMYSISMGNSITTRRSYFDDEDTVYSVGTTKKKMDGLFYLLIPAILSAVIVTFYNNVLVKPRINAGPIISLETSALKTPAEEQERRKLKTSRDERVSIE